MLNISDLSPVDKTKVFEYLKWNSCRSEKYKILYVSTPKVASTSLKWWFASLEGCSQALRGLGEAAGSSSDQIVHEFHRVAPHVSGLEMDVLMESVLSDSYFRFAVVRNPYKRIFSAWQSKILLQEPQQVAPFLEVELFQQPIKSAADVASSFEAFLEHLASNRASSFEEASWAPQTTLLRPDLINYSLLVKIENPSELHKALSEHLGEQTPDPFAEPTPSENIIPFLPAFITERSASLIRLLYAEDFDVFEYDRQVPEGTEAFSEEKLDLAFDAIRLIRESHQQLGARALQINGLTQQVEDLNQRIASLNPTMLERETQLKELMSSLVKRDRHIASLEQSVGVLNRQLVDLKAALVDHEKEGIDLKAELLKTEQELRAVLSSHSWRLTLVVRKASGLVRDSVQAVRTASWSKVVDSLRRRRELYNETTLREIHDSGLFDADYYLATNADVREKGMDPLKHYMLRGWIENRNPCAAFSPSDYLLANPDVAEAQVHPLLHYIQCGQLEGRPIRLPARLCEMTTVKRRPVGRNTVFKPYGEYTPIPVLKAVIDAQIEAIKKSGLFDEKYYLAMYSDVEQASVDPLRHYCEQGWREGKNPSMDFDTRAYLGLYKDIQNIGLNPLWHYIVTGAAEHRIAVPDALINHENDIRFGDVNSDIKLLAFYVSPDWNALRSARFASKGNPQRSRPDKTLGFYDSLDSRVLTEQARSAKSHGFFGFCFKLSADSVAQASPQPLDIFLAHTEIDFNFCVQIDLHQDGLSNNLIAPVVEVLSDKRCVQVAGRPVIVVKLDEYDDNIVDSIRKLRERLNELCDGVYLIAQFGFAGAEELARTLDGLCDAVLDLSADPVPGETGVFPPQNKNGIDTAPYNLVASQGIVRAQNAHRHAVPVFHAISLARDETALKQYSPLVYSRFHIRDYGRWLDAAISGARKAHPEDRRLLFVNAWNNWQEGLFLEPDSITGFGRLNETTRALLDIDSSIVMPKVSVIVPNYNHESYLGRRLDSIYGQTYKNIEVILMDDCSTDDSRSVLTSYAEKYPDITRLLFNETNSGGVFHQWAKGIKAATGDLVWVAESDDYCDERFLDALVSCFDDEAVMLAYSKCEFVTTDEVVMPDQFLSYVSDLECAKKWTSSYVNTAHNEVRSALGIKNTIPNASGAIFKRPIDMPLLDDQAWLSMKVAGDWVFYLHILRGGKIAYSTEGTNFFRRHFASTANTTYRKEVFYRELGVANRTVQSLYNVPLSVLESCEESSKKLYDHYVGGSAEEFLRWYDHDSIIRARADRLPNVMVSTIGFYPGGAEILPIRLANEFKRQGISVSLFSAGIPKREDGVRKMLRNDVPVIETSNIESVKAIIHDFGIEALNSHQWYVQKYPVDVPDVFSELGAHVAALHGMIEHGNGVTDEQLRIADKGVSTWVYTAEKNLVPFSDISLYDKSSPRFVKVPNGLQPPEIVPISRVQMGIPDDAFVLCCVSRAIPDKGWNEAIQAVELARSLSGRDIRIILVGNGLVYDEYCQSGAPDFVYLAGFSDNSVGHYAAADMGIMLSTFRSESFPLTIVDCLFAGKPYIATDVGDIKNMLTIESGVAGEIIELEDWVVPIESTARVIAAFATDERKYREAVGLVKDVSSRYRIDAVASQYLRLFERDIQLHRAESAKAGVSSIPV
jgi:glycosyltransferase involved in cell wall biosynthesis